MFYILYTDTDGDNTWELISGRDAMDARVDELIESGLDVDDIIVFDADCKE